ncbi:MAG: hypothetical protein ACKVH0_07100, partial [Alphaproteobacteria bacterium]
WFKIRGWTVFAIVISRPVIGAIIIVIKQIKLTSVTGPSVIIVAVTPIPIRAFLVLMFFITAIAVIVIYARMPFSLSVIIVTIMVPSA